MKELMTRRSFESIEFKEARLLDPQRKMDFIGDLLVENGRIAGIQKKGEDKPDHWKASESLNLSGQVISPSFVDLHSVFTPHGFENLNHGSIIGKAGGYSKVALLPTQDHPLDRSDSFADYQNTEATDSKSDFVPIGGLTKNLLGNDLSEIGLLAQKGVRVFSQGSGSLEDAYLMRKALEYTSSFGCTTMIFPEQKELAGKGLIHQGWMSTKLGLRGIPVSAEETAVARDLILAKHANARIHFAQISSEASVLQIRQAKEKGIKVTADVSPEHLFFTDKEVADYETAFKLRPPLREESDRKALIEGLLDGTIDAVASHHLPFSTVEKTKDFEHAPFGSIGLETCAPALLDQVDRGLLSLERAIDALTYQPAQILQSPVPGLEVGAPAELTCIDPQAQQCWKDSVFMGRAKNSSFLEKNLKGSIVWTLKGKNLFQKQN